MKEIGKVYWYITQNNTKGAMLVTEVGNNQVNGIRLLDNTKIFIQYGNVKQQIPEEDYPEFYL